MSPCSPFLLQLEAKLRRNRECIETLCKITAKIHEVRMLAKIFPEKRPELCKYIEELTTLALRIEELRKI